MNTTLLQNALVELVTGLVIKAGTGGDKTKESARATEIIAINAAIADVANGNVVTGLAAVQAAAETKALDPSESLALQSFISFASTLGSAAQAILGGTVAGQVDTAIVLNILAAGTATAKLYV